MMVLLVFAIWIVFAVKFDFKILMKSGTSLLTSFHVGSGGPKGTTMASCQDPTSLVHVDNYLLSTGFHFEII